MRTGNYMRLRKWNSGRISCWTLKPSGGVRFLKLKPDLNMSTEKKLWRSKHMWVVVWKNVKTETAGEDRRLLVKWISHLQGGISSAMNSAPQPDPPSPGAVRPGARSRPPDEMRPLAPGSRPLPPLGAGIVLSSSPSQFPGCWNNWFPGWRAGWLVFVPWKWAAATWPRGGSNSQRNSEQQPSSALLVGGAPGILGGDFPAAGPSFFLLSPLQPHRSRHTGLWTWIKGPH